MKTKPQSKLSLVYHQDPGHGWLEVPRHLVPDEILTQVSQYSYQKGGDVFLEEDCDMPLYLKWLQQNGGYELVELHTDKNHYIRNYQSFRL